MNDATAWRLALAQKIAASYARSPNAIAVMVAGSVGRGRADQYSDIEIDVYYAEPPTDAERIAAVEGCGGVIELLDQDDDEWEEQMVVGGFHAASSTFLVSTLERYLAVVVDQAEIAPAAQVRLASLQQAIPVKGLPEIEQWRAKAAHYPRELSYTMLHANLPFRGFWYAEEMLAARDDLLLLYRLFVDVERQIIGALLGLNQLYMPTPDHMKWMDEMITAMQLKPTDLATRLKQAFHINPVEGVRSLKTIIAEVFTLVETHLPEFDTAPYRANLGRKRPVWDAPPPGLVY